MARADKNESVAGQLAGAAQVATQQTVSEIQVAATQVFRSAVVRPAQAYSGMLQSAPSILFTLFAGPLSDQYGRKPLILSALFGYFLLNIVFFVNSYWFYQLSAEYLLLECLQVQLFCKQSYVQQVSVKLLKMLGVQQK